MNVSELNEFYDRAESSLEKHFAEQRSNLRIKAGYHYKNDSHQLFQRKVAESKMSSDVKIRITKNHTHVISNIIKNSISALCPDVGIFPKNKKEYGDQKATELYSSVWEDLKSESDYQAFKRGLISDFIDIGEAWGRVFYDKNAGKIDGWEVEQHPETGEVLTEEGKETPVFSGKIVFERLFGFNVMTDPNAKSFQDSDIIVRKQLKTKELEARYKDKTDKLKFIEDCKDEVFKIFDGLQSDYSYSDKGMTMIREFYFRPCAKYPQGYYYFATSAGILEEGTLELGFPIFYKGFDDMPTTARATGFIKQIKSNQIEVNRCASQMVLHSITLGDDKVFFQAGSKLSNANYFPGLRAFHYTGQPPTTIPGRTGAQFLDLMQFNIDEMYRIANVPQHIEQKPDRMDPMAALYRSLRDKKTFTIYSEKIEELLCEVASFALENARVYYSDERLIPAIGKDEYVNIQEFRAAPTVRHLIKVIPKTDDAESVMGKSLQMQQLLQYGASQMTPQQLGIIATNMPFLNEDPMLEEFTADVENANNDILALDRGEKPPVYFYDNNEFIVQKLMRRTKRRDFGMLPPPVQQLYQQQIQEHENLIAQKTMASQRLEQGFIPADGPVAKVQLYRPNPATGKMELIKIPVASIDWLIAQLESQGQTQQMIGTLDPNVQADIGNMISQAPPQSPQQEPNPYQMAM